MIFLRMGLLFLMLIRVLTLIPRLRQQFSGDNASIEVGGVPTPFQYRVLRTGKYKSVTGVQLALEIPDRVRFRIKRENAFDRFAKRLGIAQEWQTGDREFDASAYILSDDAVWLSALSQNEALRAAVGDLLNQKLMYEPARLTLRCSRGTLWIEVVHSADRSDRDIDIAHRLAEQFLPILMRVQDELKTLDSDLWRASRDPGMQRQNALLALTGVLGVVGLIAFVQPEIMRTSFPRQIVVDAISRHVWTPTAIALAALLFIAWAVVGRRSRLHWVMFEIVLIAFPAFWFIAGVESEWQNQRYDDSEPAVREVHVDSKYVEGGRKSYFFLTISGWPDTRAGSQLRVDSWLYGQFDPPTCAQVVWHAGSLGDPWISRITPSTCGDLVR